MIISELTSFEINMIIANMYNANTILAVLYCLYAIFLLLGLIWLNFQVNYQK